MKPRKIKDIYGDTVTVVTYGGGELRVETDQAHGRGQRTVMVFTQEQSRKLRKALKRAEQAT